MKKKITGFNFFFFFFLQGETGLGIFFLIFDFCDAFLSHGMEFAIFFSKRAQGELYTTLCFFLVIMEEKFYEIFFWGDGGEGGNEIWSEICGIYFFLFFQKKVSRMVFFFFSFFFFLLL